MRPSRPIVSISTQGRISDAPLSYDVRRVTNKRYNAAANDSDEAPSPVKVSRRNTASRVTTTVGTKRGRTSDSPLKPYRRIERAGQDTRRSGEKRRRTSSSASRRTASGGLDTPIGLASAVSNNDSSNNNTSSLVDTARGRSRRRRAPRRFTFDVSQEPKRAGSGSSVPDSTNTVTPSSTDMASPLPQATPHHGRRSPEKPVLPRKRSATLGGTEPDLSGDVTEEGVDLDLAYHEEKLGQMSSGTGVSVDTSAGTDPLADSGQTPTSYFLVTPKNADGSSGPAEQKVITRAIGLVDVSGLNINHAALQSAGMYSPARPRPMYYLVEAQDVPPSGFDGPVLGAGLPSADAGGRGENPVFNENVPVESSVFLHAAKPETFGDMQITYLTLNPAALSPGPVSAPVGTPAVSRATSNDGTSAPTPHNHPPPTTRSSTSDTGPPRSAAVRAPSARLRFRTMPQTTTALQVDHKAAAQDSVHQDNEAGGTAPARAGTKPSSVFTFEGPQRRRTRCAQERKQLQDVPRVPVTPAVNGPVQTPSPVVQKVRGPGGETHSVRPSKKHDARALQRVVMNPLFEREGAMKASMSGGASSSGPVGGHDVIAHFKFSKPLNEMSYRELRHYSNLVIRKRYAMAVGKDNIRVKRKNCPFKIRVGLPGNYEFITVTASFPKKVLSQVVKYANTLVFVCALSGEVVTPQNVHRLIHGFVDQMKSSGKDTSVSKYGMMAL